MSYASSRGLIAFGGPAEAGGSIRNPVEVCSRGSYSGNFSSSIGGCVKAGGGANCGGGGAAGWAIVRYTIRGSGG